MHSTHCFFSSVFALSFSGLGVLAKLGGGGKGALLWCFGALGCFGGALA